MTGSWLPIRYRDFYDVPRMLIVEYVGHLYLFDAPFDDEADEYSDRFTVYRLPDESRSKVELDSWAELPGDGEAIGQVPMEDVEFDETKRQLMSAHVFRDLGVDP